ncbi:MAG TPA: SDR family NAD(P)-dependent oxidoreductase [Vicinamibacterales bacterium]|nr:SDR family NAD(P)-dependent oxidoreductase [Vicinamibacterales bacterium]
MTDTRLQRWAGRKVLVTGAGGFIGSHLVERLLDLGAEVTGFLRYNSRNDAGFLDLLGDRKKQVSIVRGDIRDLPAIRSVVEGHDTVFHLAALVGIPYSFVHPEEVVAVNTIGTVNVLTAARSSKVGRIVITSTSEVYGSARYVPIDERHPKQPQSPYSASKIAADAIALSYHLSFELPVTIVRPFNTFGPRQSDRAIIPTIISQALSKGEIVLGNLSPTRDFTYVTDTVEGFLCAAEIPQALGHEFNLGTGHEISIGDLAARIGALLKQPVPVRQAEERTRRATSEVSRLLSSNQKACDVLGWRPQMSLDDGLRRTIEWVRRSMAMYDPGTYRI